MRFATIGANAELDGVVESLLEGGGFWLAAVGDPTQLEVGPRTEIVEEWEDLLQFPKLDLIVVAADAEPRDEALRKLVQADADLLMIHPVCVAIVAIELEMIRDDVGTRIDTYCPLTEHPAFQRVASIVNAARSDGGSPLGAIQQVVMQRRLPVRDDDTVLWTLARDCEVLRRLSGRMRHVNAMGEAGKGVGFHNLSVNMTSLDDVVHRWSVVPGDPALELRIVGERGDVALEIEGDQCRYVSAAENETYPSDAGREEAISRLLASEKPSPDWTEIRHSLEIAEAAERSAVKGKTIELFEESYTEESSFKGLMAIGGCGLLLLTFLFAIVWSAIEGVRLPAERNRYERERAMSQQSADERPQEVKPTTPLVLRLWPAYPFAAFLLLQFFRLVFTKPKTSDESSTTDRSNTDDTSPDS